MMTLSALPIQPSRARPLRRAVQYMLTMKSPTRAQDTHRTRLSSLQDLRSNAQPKRRKELIEWSGAWSFHYSYTLLMLTALFQTQNADGDEAPRDRLLPKSNKRLRPISLQPTTNSSPRLSMVPTKSVTKTVLESWPFVHILYTFSLPYPLLLTPPTAMFMGNPDNETRSFRSNHTIDALGQEYLSPITVGYQGSYFLHSKPPISRSFLDSHKIAVRTGQGSGEATRSWATSSSVLTSCLYRGKFRKVKIP
ncbi:hypothetical protein PM082_016553 [Marasmius tenuissimus]|nr:hypothetical protein PM082_016553 [Marasmius tenuissimus]